MRKSCYPLCRVLTILFTLGSLGTIFLKWTGTGFSYFDPLEKLVEGFGTYGFGTMMGERDNLVFLLSFCLLILFALLTVLLAARGRLGAGVWYLLASVFAFCVILYAVEWSVEDLRLGAWLCAALAAAGLICSLIGGTAPAPTPSCPACGGSRGQPEASAPARRCSFCGAALRAVSAFCPNCGRLVPKPAPAAKPRCSFCGTELRPGMAFCTSCGRAVGPGPTAARREAARGTSANPAGFHSAGDDEL